MSPEVVWREALELAADLLMDHGVIKTGSELERVCEQIRNLTRPYAGPEKREIFVEISAYDLQILTPPRGNMNDVVLRYLQVKGIPAVRISKRDGQFLVSSGRIRYWHDLEKNVHSFHWEDLVDERVPF